MSLREWFTDSKRQKPQKLNLDHTREVVNRLLSTPEGQAELLLVVRAATGLRDLPESEARSLLLKL